MLIGYARVSTIDQDTRLQLDALRDAGCERIYEEHASTRKERPVFAQVLDVLRPGDVLIVWKLDRLGRSLIQLVNTVNDLAAKDIGVRVLTGAPIDTSSATGRLQLSMFAAFAEFERDLTHERIMAGLAAARRAGKVGGRPRAISAEALAKAHLLLAGEWTMADVAKDLGVDRTTLWRALRT
jgi:DNA invertase Pin-like site-specific DNA recombinase